MNNHIRNKAITLIYINPGNSSVMEAQVLSLLNYYTFNSQEIKKVILLQGYKNRNEFNILKSKLNKPNYSTIWFKTWPNYTWFIGFAYYSLKKIINHLKTEKNVLFHVRGEKYGALMAYLLHQNKISANLIVDIRGAQIEEFQYYKKLNFLIKNKQQLINKSYSQLKNNIPVTVVSEALNNYLVNKHQFNKNNISIHPNIASLQFKFNYNKRIEIRKQLGIKQNEVVAVCSSKGNALWQKDKDIIIDLVKLNIKVINLTPNIINLNGVINKIVSFNEVQNYLSAADIAILWRDKNIVNEVASPSKFSEFVCNGLLIVHNGTVDIACKYIIKTGLGVIIQNKNQLTPEIIQKVKSINRYSASQTGLKYFGIEKISKSYIETYKKIIKNHIS